MSRIVRPSGLRLVQPLDLTISEQSRAAVVSWFGKGRFEADETKPHILIQPQGSALFVRGGAAPFTSVALAFAKQSWH